MSPKSNFFANDQALSSPSQLPSAPSVVPADLNDAHISSSKPLITPYASHHTNCSEDNLLTPMILDIFSWPAFQAIVYFFLLIYLFLGIAIVSDIFMCSIEKITSRTKIIRIQREAFARRKSRPDLDQVTTESGANGNVNSLPQRGWSLGNRERKKEDVESTAATEEIEVKVWNDTVANLTLMALGSSAPEILLSIIEIVGSGFKAGELGAGTIVGSAAFNLLIISASCVSALPNGISKRIKFVNVFAITSFFSIFAYIWLLLILVVISPEIIELWEAILTFSFFILLVTSAYYADKNASKNEVAANENSFNETSPSNVSSSHRLNFFPQGRITKKSLEAFMAEVKKIDPNLTDEDTACLAAAHLFENEHHSRMFYRVSAIRSLTGVPAPIPHLSERLKGIYDSLKDKTNAIVAFSRGYTNVVSGSVAHTGDSSDLRGIYKVFDNGLTTPMKVRHSSRSGSSKYGSNWSRSNDLKNGLGRQGLLSSTFGNQSDAFDIAIIEFSQSVAYAYENDGSITLDIVRIGKLNNKVTVMVTTIDHTATCNIDYKPLKQAVTFIPGERVKSIKIQIIDNNIWNPDRLFLAKLFLPDDDEGDDSRVAIGSTCITAITIVNDDEPGNVSFPSKIFTFGFHSDKVVIPVVRENGSDGEMKVKYCVNDGTAKNGRDFICFPPEDEIRFSHGMKCHEIIVPLCVNNTEDRHRERELFFDINLTSCDIETDEQTRRGKECDQEASKSQSNVCRLGQNRKAVIVITHNNDVNTTKLLAKVNAARDGFRLNADAWKDQIKSAISINTEEVTGVLPWFLHVISFHWKILFALIPPTAIWGGWLTFSASLAIIGIITAIIGDVATTFGCLIGIEKSLNAITFVALGTSMPDLFASRTAVQMDSSADNAIGNITGSNSVNVFLGLGLPWLLAAIYWTAQGEYFKVPSGDLAFGVALYTGAAIIAIITLVVRRLSSTLGSGEVGGPKNCAWATSALFVLLWLLYIALSALSIYHYI